MATILVAGATGLVGRELTQLLRDERFEVRTLSRNPKRAEALRALGAYVRTGDATDPATLHGLCDGVEIVVSCIGAPVVPAWSERRGFREVDTVANRNLLDVALKSGVRRFVYVSVHVEAGYEATSYVQAHEAFIGDLRRAPISSGVVRCTALYPILLPYLDMARRGVALVFGPGHFVTNPVHPRDVAEACMRAVQGEAGDLSIGGPEVFSRDEIARLAFAALGRKPHIVHVPRPVVLGVAKIAGLFHRRLGNLFDFAGRVFTTKCVAPAIGVRRLADYFASRVNPR